MESPIVYEYSEIPVGMTCADYRRLLAKRRRRRRFARARRIKAA